MSKNFSTLNNEDPLALGTPENLADPNDLKLSYGNTTIPDGEYIKRAAAVLKSTTLIQGALAANKRGQICQPNTNSSFELKAAYASLLGVLVSVKLPEHIWIYIDNLIKLNRQETILTFSGSKEEARELLLEAYANLDEYKLN